MSISAGVRTFVAVLASAALQRAIGTWQARFAALGADVRWVEPDNLHFTLKFLGAIAPERVAEVETAVRRGLAAVRPFSLECVGFGAFADWQSPRVLWAGVGEGADQLIGAAARIDAALAAAGFPSERRPRRPHLTIGRFRSARNARAVQEAAAAGGTLERQVVEAVHVMKSVLTPHGPIYTSLARVALDGSAGARL